jgi:uroporphyrinogen-III decarboxylase
MYRDPGAWKELMGRFVRAITRYLNAQIAAGVQCVQLFDSWAGCLGSDDYRRYVLPYVQGIIEGLVPGVPVINFATGNPALIPLLAESGSRVVGVDWRIRLDEAWDQIGHDRSIQGNLDPGRLYGDDDRERGLSATVAWLCEEMGELAQAVRKGSPDEQLHELGDVLAWLSSLANQLGLSLDEAVGRYVTDPP